jgi:uncharacterized phage protein (TIGR02218 family)
MAVRKARIGEVRVSGKGFSAELRGFTQGLEQIIGEVYTPTCRADLYDLRCKVLSENFDVAGTITSVTSAAIFADSSRTEPDDWFGAGEFIWTSGLNNGVSMEVKAWTASSKTFELMLPMSRTVQVGDAYVALAGCRKRFEADCVTKFNNAVNFRGEPHVPGLDAMFRR